MEHEMLAQHGMSYIVEVFDKKSETLIFEVRLPTGSDAQLEQIMGWHISSRKFVDELHARKCNDSSAVRSHSNTRTA
jgi:hypothetical protein